MRLLCAARRRLTSCFHAGSMCGCATVLNFSSLQLRLLLAEYRIVGLRGAAAACTQTLLVQEEVRGRMSRVRRTSDLENGGFPGCPAARACALRVSSISRHLLCWPWSPDAPSHSPVYHELESLSHDCDGAGIDQCVTPVAIWNSGAEHRQPVSGRAAAGRSRTGSNAGGAP